MSSNFDRRKELKKSMRQWYIYKDHLEDSSFMTSKPRKEDLENQKNNYIILYLDYRKQTNLEIKQLIHISLF